MTPAARRWPSARLRAASQAPVLRQGLPPAEPAFQQSRPRIERALVTLLLCALLLVCGLSALPLGLQYYRQYQRDLPLAKQGLHQFEAAKTALLGLMQNPLDAQRLVQAKQAFAQAQTTFSQLNDDLQLFPTAARLIPHYGPLLSASLHVAPAAMELAQAGVLGCEALQLVSARVRNPFDPRTQSLTLADLNTLNRYFAQIQQLFNNAAQQIQQVPPTALSSDPSFEQAITSFQNALPGIQKGLESLQALLGLAPTLLGMGQPAHYLVEMMDSTELRPTGGFIGNYGILTLANGRLASLFMTDVDLLDTPYARAGHVIPFPPQYNWFRILVPSWSFRDSNLDANFATAAQNGEQLYHQEGGTVPLQGVIGLTPWLIQDMLRITGPISVPEYGETITADNLVNRIHYHQLGAQEGPDYTPDPNGHSSLRKRFTEILFEHFLTAVQHDAARDLPQFFHVLASSLASKDLELYFNAPAAEETLQRYHLASALEAPAGDSLFVVDANVNANKANYFITPTMRDQVTLDAEGRATHQLTLTYAWPASAESLRNDYGRKFLYIDYVRVYVPPGSVLEAQAGWQPEGTSTAFRREVWAGYFRLQYGQTGAITLTWVVPGAATKDASGWHYRLLLQKQAGITWQLDMQVTLPACGIMAGTPLGVSTSTSRQATVSQQLTTDLKLGIDYICSP